jgi:hypothetical protein
MKMELNSPIRQPDPDCEAKFLLAVSEFTDVLGPCTSVFGGTAVAWECPNHPDTGWGRRADHRRVEC